ncbi:hypothetical protein LTR17_003890 [Elasticomyces elasticus]|nr:hypothetical protein LTR17_003890 [Elasticomyces elasticus]
MPSTKHTVVFVTGAWHLPHLYGPLLEPLEAAGYTVLAPRLPSVGGIYDDFRPDVEAVRMAVQSAFELGSDVVLVMHSSGGVIGSEAVQGLGKQDRSAGTPGVTRMVYLCAFALPEQVSLWDALGGNPLPWWEAIGQNREQWKVKDAHSIFYNDVDPKLAETMTEQLMYQSHGHFTSKLTYAAWKHIPSGYIICTKDMAIPLHVQKRMSTQPGSGFEIERLEASHTPFYSVPEEAVRVVRKALAMGEATDRSAADSVRSQTGGSRLLEAASHAG